MDTIATALEAGMQLRHLRSQRGLTQQQLADDAGVSRKFVADFESGHERAELGKALQLMQAAGLTVLTDRKNHPLQNIVDACAHSLSEEIGKDDEFALRLLMKTVAFILRRDDLHDALLTEPPERLPSKWDRLLKSSIAYALRKQGLQPPAWTRAAKLRSEWYPANPSTSAYTELTKKQTPPELSRVNVFLREKTLIAGG
ncbi:helix-turn-helix domain-containing protein [Arthrobacter sp. Z1-15]